MATGLNGRRVLVTGHTGFKGSWLSLLLKQQGAVVAGYALAPDTNPALFDQARIAEAIDHHVVADIRDPERLTAEIAAFAPDLVFHLAAQPLVRLSYDQPVETFDTNVMGTVHLLEACRRTPSVKAIVAVTSDKCYANREWDRPYREDDAMGGHDPYSASKGAAELVIASWRDSFFHADGSPLLASVRAGNVIGGGDWSTDRLVPDLVRAFLADQVPAIRAPHAVRPWQHVLEALVGYVMIAQRLLAGDRRAATAWNFGPDEADQRPVADIVAMMAAHWGRDNVTVPWDGVPRHEAGLLKLDCTKARGELGWRPTLSLDQAIGLITDWHKAVAGGADARTVTNDQINFFLERARASMSMVA